jgi:hypothetical protein
VLWVVDNVLEEQGAKSVSDAAASVIDCAALSALLPGNDDINRTGKPNPIFPVAEWAVPGLTRPHAGAWPLALDLFEEGHLRGPAVTAVRARLLGLGKKPADLAAAAQAAVTAGYLRAETVAAFP